MLFTFSTRHPICRHIHHRSTMLMSHGMIVRIPMLVPSNRHSRIVCTEKTSYSTLWCPLLTFLQALPIDILWLTCQSKIWSEFCCFEISPVLFVILQTILDGLVQDCCSLTLNHHIILHITAIHENMPLCHIKSVSHIVLLLTAVYGES